jgi:hypothetical protein
MLSMGSLPTGIVLGKRYREAIQWDTPFLIKAHQSERPAGGCATMV